ncbi:hypothetical protein NOC27_1095 [Nitrosococcus oceani AFC27]|nr:hypothetical protein NOC27_1095 [Nitrosococcus oceani AFC27]
MEAKIKIGALEKRNVPIFKDTGFSLSKSYRISTIGVVIDFRWEGGDSE